MAWNDDCEAEVTRLIDTQDVAEVLTKAVETIIEGKIDALMVSLGHGAGCDPKQTIDFGEKLLIACVDKIRGRL